MSNRSEHLFEFTAAVIADAARAEGAYHRERWTYWQKEQEDAFAAAERTIYAKLVKTAMTGGWRYDVSAGFGDPAPMNRLNLAQSKISTHQAHAERYETDARVYGSQPPGKVYELDADDVFYYRLGGNPRED